MKQLLLTLAMGVAAQAWSQTQTGLPKGPINNQWVVSTSGLDTLWIQTGGVGDLTLRIWQEDPCLMGLCPKIVPVPDLEPFRRRYCMGITTGMLEERP